MIIQLLDDIKKSRFKKNLFIMIGGSSVSQLIPILLSFFLTRIYTPEDFGILSNFTSIMGFLVVFMLLKFDMAIVLPKKDGIAANLVVLCFVIGLFFFVIFTILFYFFKTPIYNLFNINSNQKFLLYIPFAALIFSFFTIINEWFVRREFFSSLILNKIVNNSMITFVSAGIPYIMSRNLGLIKGQIIGQMIAVVFGAYVIFKRDASYFKFVDLRIIKKLFFKYLNFAKFNIPGQFLNTLTGQITILYLTSQFGLKVVGLYALTDRIMGVPLSFIGNAIRDVFKQKAAIDYRNNGECKEVYMKTTFFLFLIVIIPMILISLFAPILFELLFGKKWMLSGVYAQILFGAYLLSFITMPTGWLFVIAERQKLDLIWQVIFLAIIIISLLFSYVFFKSDIIFTLTLLSIGRSFAYLIQMFMTYKLAIGNKNCILCQ